MTARGITHPSPRSTVLLALGWLVGLTLTPEGNWALFAIHTALLLGIRLKSKLPWRIWLQRSLWVSPFFLVALPLPFTTPGEPAFALILGPISIVASRPGLLRLVSLILRIGLSWQVTLLLLGNIPREQILLALRALHLPPLLVGSVALMLRYLDVLTETAQTLLRARAGRSPQPPPNRPNPSRLLWQAWITGGMAGNLILRALERSERLHAAMLARGFDGEIRPLPQPPAQCTEAP